MNCPAEHILLFYAALPEHDGEILSRAREWLDRGIDAEYLVAASESYGVAAGLAALLTAAEGPDRVSEALRMAAERELAVTASMRSLYDDVAALLDGEGIPFVPLKGCDCRISGAVRRHSNPMRDVDLLIRPGDIHAAGRLLMRSGYLHLGALSGAHMNFATDEENPRFLEIHWDLVNRHSPVQRRLFSPRMEEIWERCSVLCGRLHLSSEDLICYLAEHAAKEYFRRPKWIADLACILDTFPSETDPARLREAIREWGVAGVLGITVHALASVLPGRPYEALFSAGAKRPGILGRFVAARLFWYSRLHPLRPLCSLAFAPTAVKALSVAVGVGERAVFGRRRK